MIGIGSGYAINHARTKGGLDLVTCMQIQCVNGGETSRGKDETEDNRTHHRHRPFLSATGSRLAKPTYVEPRLRLNSLTPRIRFLHGRAAI